MNRLVFALCTFVFLALPPLARSQVSIGAAVNAASFLNSSLPNGKLAQGGMFTGFGVGMGPADLVRVSAFPLPTSLAGTSVQAAVGGVSVDCIMIFTRADQLAAILPSNTPVGAGTLTVSFNGQTSPPLAIEVVAHNFGIFTINQSGAGPGVLTDPIAAGQPANTLFESAAPGSLWDIWGTGLGAVAGDEAAGPSPGDMSGLDVQVFVGGKPAQVVYRGRSGCCAGVDQIRIVIPEGVEGCYVPVVVVINGIPSNFTTMSVSSSGSICSDPGGALPGDLEILLSRGELRFGQVALGRTWTEINLPQGELLQRGDTALAAFLTFSLQQTLRAPGEISTLDSCVVTQLSVGSAVEISGLDAGTVTLGGDIGSFDLASLGAGSHLLSFSPDIPNVPGVTGVVNDGTLLTPGDYTFTISGGADVSAATASITLPEPLDWTNRAALDVIDLNAPLVINWTGGTPGSFVQIVGRSPSALGPNGFVGASFVCRADATAGTYTVPNRVLAALPPSMEIGGAPSGNLQVGTQVFSDRFEAPGIDFGLVWFNDAFVKNVSYR